MYKRALSKITKEIVVAITVFMCLLQTLSYGATQEEAGASLAQWCINFYNEHASQTKYPRSDFEWAQSKKTYECAPGTLDCYMLDCVGWVSYAIHWGLGLGDNTFTFFGVPPGGSTIGGVYGRNNPAFYNGFEKVYGTWNEKDIVDNIPEILKPGDLLSKHYSGEGRHILIYVGEVNGVPSVIHMGGLSLDPVSNFQYCNVGRITPEAAAKAKPAVAGVTAWDEEDEEFIIDENFYGLPLEGQYTGSTTLFGWIFDLLTQFIDYLAGMIFAVIKIEIIGWVRIFENGVTSIINTITKTETTSAVSNVPVENENKDEEDKSSTDADVQIGKINNTDENDVITIEDIIYNRVPILDANVFNFKNAGGLELKSDSVIYKLRETIAKWYEVFRRVSIVVMLGMLIYLGIRMSLSSVAEKKASYKKALTAWVTGFILIFFVHYIMILVLNINSSLVELFNDIIAKTTELESTEGTIYDTMLTRAYSLPLSISLPGTVMYLVLVYYMLKFLYIYIKRYLVLNILTLMAPVMVLKYTFESAGTGKRSKAISNWLSDYIFNVLIQLIHALLYCSLMIIALNMSSESVAGFVIALVIMHFISEASKIMMNIFNFGKGKSAGDVNQPRTTDDTLGDVLIGYTAVKTAKNWTKAAVKLPAKAVKGAGNFALDIADIWSEKDSRGFFKDKYHQAELGVQGFFTERVLRGQSETFNNLLEAKRALYSKGGSAEDEKIRKTLQARKMMKRKMRKDAFSYGKAALTNAGKMIVSIPMMVASPKYGLNMARSAFNNIRNSSRVIEGYIPTKHKFYPKNKAARALLNAATLGMAGASVNALAQARKNKDRIKNELPADASTLAKAGIVAKDIYELYKELTKDDKDKEKTEEEKKKDEEVDKFFHDITQDQINLNDIRDEIDSYMFGNNIDELRLEDVSSVIKSIESLYGREINEDYRARLESTVKVEFNKRLTSEKQTLSVDEAADAIKEGIATTHSVDISTLDDKQQQIVSKIEELNRLEMESTQKRGKQVIDADSIIKKIQRNNREN